jgi:hypothetical protein
VKSVTFKGKNIADLGRQEWAWRRANESNPKFAVKKVHIYENLPAELTRATGTFAAKNPVPDRLSRRIDYED